MKLLEAKGLLECQFPPIYIVEQGKQAIQEIITTQ